MEAHILLEAQWKLFTLEQTSELGWMSWLSQPKGAEGHVESVA